MLSKKTIVLGASDHPERYSYKAVIQLQQSGYEVVAVGNRVGNIQGVAIHTGRPALNSIDTITVYLNPEHQKDWYNYILSVYPKRIILNPGAENDELKRIAQEHGIQVEESCTLVLLSTGQY